MAKQISRALARFSASFVVLAGMGFLALSLHPMLLYVALTLTVPYMILPEAFTAALVLSGVLSGVVGAVLWNIEAFQNPVIVAHATIGVFAGLLIVTSLASVFYVLSEKVKKAD